jgi:hypothetical protein
MTNDAKRALLAKYRATVAPTLDGYPAVICGTKNGFATVATINGLALRADYSWLTVARILANGGAFKA